MKTYPKANKIQQNIFRLLRKSIPQFLSTKVTALPGDVKVLKDWNHFDPNRFIFEWGEFSIFH